MHSWRETWASFQIKMSRDETKRDTILIIVPRQPRISYSSRRHGDQVSTLYIWCPILRLHYLFDMRSQLDTINLTSYTLLKQDGHFVLLLVSFLFYFQPILMLRDDILQRTVDRDNLNLEALTCVFINALWKTRVWLCQNEPR